MTTEQIRAAMVAHFIQRAMPLSAARAQRCGESELMFYAARHWAEIFPTWRGRDPSGHRIPVDGIMPVPTRYRAPVHWLTELPLRWIARWRLR